MVAGKYYCVDAHCHIYPDRIAERAVAGTSAFYGIEFDCGGRVRDLAAAAAEAGVDHCVVQSVATSPRQVRSINAFIAGAVADAGGRLTGLGTLHPESEDLAGDLADLQSLGLCGVKLHADIQGFAIDDPRCMKIYELCEQAGLLMLLHTGDHRYDYSNPNRLFPVLKAFPGLTVIGAHLGGWSVWDEACATLAGMPNLYVDCSSSMPFLPPARVREIIGCYGADRVLFGTDYPMWAPATELTRFFALGLTEAENAAILGGNAQQLFGIGEKGNV